MKPHSDEAYRLCAVMMDRALRATGPLPRDPQEAYDILQPAIEAAAGHFIASCRPTWAGTIAWFARNTAKEVFFSNYRGNHYRA